MGTFQCDLTFKTKSMFCDMTTYNGSSVSMERIYTLDYDE